MSLTDTIRILSEQIAANPTDETTRLIYADALDETGDEGRAIEAATIRADIAIRQAARAKLATLEAVLAEKRAERVAGIRALAVEGVAQDDPAYPVCVLLARTLVIGGRADDGYPTEEIPAATQTVIARAFAAGLLPSAGGPAHKPYIRVGALTIYSDGSGVYSGTGDLHDADYRAWSAASDFRKANKASL